MLFHQKIKKTYILASCYYSYRLLESESLNLHSRSEGEVSTSATVNFGEQIQLLHVHTGRAEEENLKNIKRRNLRYPIF